MRPPSPLPTIPAKLKPLSAARDLANGEALMRPVLANGASAAGAGAKGAAGAAGAGVDTAFSESVSFDGFNSTGDSLAAEAVSNALMSSPFSPMMARMLFTGAASPSLVPMYKSSPS